MVRYSSSIQVLTCCMRSDIGSKAPTERLLTSNSYGRSEHHTRVRANQSTGLLIITMATTKTAPRVVAGCASKRGDDR